jgi:hypothetical protein
LDSRTVEVTDTVMRVWFNGKGDICGLQGGVLEKNKLRIVNGEGRRKGE